MLLMMEQAATAWYSRAIEEAAMFVNPFYVKAKKLQPQNLARYCKAPSGFDSGELDDTSVKAQGSFAGLPPIHSSHEKAGPAGHSSTPIIDYWRGEVQEGGPGLCRERSRSQSRRKSGASNQTLLDSLSVTDH